MIFTAAPMPGARFGKVHLRAICRLVGLLALPHGDSTAKHDESRTGNTRLTADQVRPARCCLADASLTAAPLPRRLAATSPLPAASPLPSLPAASPTRQPAHWLGEHSEVWHSAHFHRWLLAAPHSSPAYQSRHSRPHPDPVVGWPFGPSWAPPAGPAGPAAPPPAPPLRM